MSAPVVDRSEKLSFGLIVARLAKGKNCDWTMKALHIYIGSRPIVRRRGVALAGGVLGEKNVAGVKCHARAVAETDIDAARERDHPAAPGRAVVVDDMRREIVAEQQPRGRPRAVEELRFFTGVERFEMGLAVIPSVQSVEFHAASVPAGIMDRNAEELSTCNIHKPLILARLDRRKAPQGESRRSRTRRGPRRGVGADSKEPGPPREKSGVAATLSAEHRMEDAPAGVEEC